MTVRIFFRIEISLSTFHARYVYALREDNARVQGHGSSACQRPALQRSAGLQRDRCLSHDVSNEETVRSESRRAANLPEDIGSLGTTGQNNLATGCHRE